MLTGWPLPSQLKVIDPRHRRASPEQLDERFDRASFPFHIHLDPPVIDIPHTATEFHARSRIPRERAEGDTLHAPAH